ncbi:MAG: hypothetical protein Q8P02_02995, partial [Candidatus Micrarchaeota archaeon]|nr:hypothetical protein [Candidatus Micrarchaeota archaeon]
MPSLPDFSKMGFTHKGFHGVLNLFSACGPNPLLELKKVFGDSYAFTVYFVHDNYVEWYWHADDMDRLGRKLIQKSAKDKAFLPKLRTLWETRCRALEREFALVEKTNLKTLSDAGLMAIYQKLLRAYLSEYAPSLGLQDAFSMRSEYHVEPVFKAFLADKGLSNEFNNFYPVLFAPVEPSFLSREHQDLLEIAVLIQKTGAQKVLLQNPAALSSYPAIQKHLARHAKQYFWVKNNYANVQALDVPYFLAQALAEKSPATTLQKAKTAHAEAKRAKSALSKKLDISPAIQNLIRISELFSFMQDERKGYVLKSNHCQVNILKEVAKRKQVSLNELLYVLP